MQVFIQDMFAYSVHEEKNYNLETNMDSFYFTDTSYMVDFRLFNTDCRISPDGPDEISWDMIWIDYSVP